MTGEHEEAGWKRPTWKHWLALSAVILLVAAVMLPPLININRYRLKIADSVSRSLGRPVHLSEVKLRLLPRPGFEISDFVVDEDPAFGAEPTLRAASVVAYVRLWSLWRGRLEVAQISLDEPSLNLVRNAQNHWNVGTVLVQASRLSNAPTGQRHAGSAPRFPYIEATDARINFKFGNEKKPFSFLNADVSMWLANPDEWQLRFLGQPVRTDLDLDLSDTGELRVNGTLHRAAELGLMPVELHAEWSHAPLGQMSRLLLGRDAGWRGDLDVTGDVTGDLQSMAVKTRMRVDGVHRVEFTPMEPLNLDTRCEGMFHRGSRSLEKVTCLSPIGDGQLLLRGGVADLDNPSPELTVELKHLPASRALDALRLVRNGFASAVRTTGTVDGEFAYRADGSAWPVRGQANISAMTVAAPGFDTAVTMPTLHFVSPGPQPAAAKERRRSKTKAAPVSETRAGLVLEPVPVPLGGATPLTVGGLFNTSGFEVRLTGGATLGRLIAVSKDFGLLAQPAARLRPQGTADLDLTFRGPWVLPVQDEEHPVASAVTAGTLHLHNARLDTGFLAEPVEIPSALGTFTAEQVTWNAAAASFHHVSVDGSLSYPVPCDSGEKACERHFDLRAGKLDAGVLEAALLGAGERGELMTAILARVDSHRAMWPVLTGTLHVESFQLGTLTLEGASAAMRVEGNTLTLSQVDARALGGSLHASGRMEASGNQPHYTLDATLTKASPAAVAGLFHETWGAGSVNAAAHLNLAGYELAQLESSAHGTFSWDWLKGRLPVDEPSPLARFDRWTAAGTFADGTLTLERSVMTRGSQKLPLKGTVTFAREYALKSLPPARAMTLTGNVRPPPREHSAEPAREDPEAK